MVDTSALDDGQRSKEENSARNGLWRRCQSLRSLISREGRLAVPMSMLPDASCLRVIVSQAYVEISPSRKPCFYWLLSSSEALVVPYPSSPFLSFAVLSSSFRIFHPIFRTRRRKVAPKTVKTLVSLCTAALMRNWQDLD